MGDCHSEIPKETVAAASASAEPLTAPDARKNLATAVVQIDARGEDCSSKLPATWQSIDQAIAKAAAASAAPAP